MRQRPACRVDAARIRDLAQCRRGVVLGIERYRSTRNCCRCGASSLRSTARSVSMISGQVADSCRRTSSPAPASRDTHRGRWAGHPGSRASRASDRAMRSSAACAADASSAKPRAQTVTSARMFTDPPRRRRTAKAHGARAVGRLHARQHRDAHHHGVVVLLFEAERAAAAEPVAVRVALLAAVVADQHGPGVLDPLPHDPVQVADTEIVGR